jgi:hypothetical protein
MFKKIISGLLMLSLIVCINPISAEVADVDGELEGKFKMTHSVARQSYFKTIVENATINEAGSTKLGSFIVRNNTRDGFKLTIESEKGGALTSANTLDGEEPIPYSVSMGKTGTIGTGITYTDNFSDAVLADSAAHDILARPGSDVQAGTDASFELYIEIDQSQSDALSLAGTYEDTLTLTYEDL